MFFFFLFFMIIVETIKFYYAPDNNKKKVFIGMVANQDHSMHTRKVFRGLIQVLKSPNAALHVVVPKEQTKMLREWRKYYPGVQFTFLTKEINTHRQELIKQAIEENYESVLLMDSDIEINPRTFFYLDQIQARNIVVKETRIKVIHPQITNTNPESISVSIPFLKLKVS